jgi:uncharacterized YccA/Bax inhibitor family protein
MKRLSILLLTLALCGCAATKKNQKAISLEGYLDTPIFDSSTSTLSTFTIIQSSAVFVSSQSVLSISTTCSGFYFNNETGSVDRISDFDRLASSSHMEVVYDSNTTQGCRWVSSTYYGDAWQKTEPASPMTVRDAIVIIVCCLLVLIGMIEFVRIIHNRP